MPATVTVVHKWAKTINQHQSGVEVIDTTSNANGSWTRDLSPFILGPCDLYGPHVSENMENAWQYSKVYAEDTDSHGEPTGAYWKWAQKGWATLEAHRYPKGRGRIPEYSLWDGEHLGYIDARKRIYGPLYIEAVTATNGWQQLLQLYNSKRELYLRDWDGWDMVRHNMADLTQVLNNPRRKMGHAFVLKMLLEDDSALQEMDLR